MRLNTILKALTAVYGDDPSGPGVQLAWLAGDGLFYAAVHRYRKQYGQGRQVVCSARGPDESTCLAELATAWQALEPAAAAALASVEESPRRREPTRRRGAHL